MRRVKYSSTIAGGALPLWCLLAGPVAAAGSPAGPAPQEAQATEKVLTDSTGLVPANEPQTRCGKFFILETRKYGDFEVKQVHVAYLIPSGVAVMGLYYSDLKVVIDESKTTPVLLEKRENPSLQKDTLKLSKSAYEQAKACIPPPEEAKGN